MSTLITILLACVFVVCYFAWAGFRTAVHSALAWCWSMRQELLGIPLALVLFLASPGALRSVDRTAGVWDVGILQNLIVAAIGLLVGNSLAHMGANLNYERLFNNPVKTADRWEYALTWALFFLGFVVLLAAL